MKIMRKEVLTRGGTAIRIQLEEDRMIGRGAFGKVRKMRMEVQSPKEQQPTAPAGNRLVALKEPTTKAKETTTRLDQTERDLLLKLRHPNIIDLLYHYDDNEGETTCLVLELVDGGDLHEFTRRRMKNKEDMGVLLETYMYQLFRGLAYIHLKGVAHRDIKPENLLVNEVRGTLKIADFGLGTMMTEETSDTPHAFYVGTRPYRAPEMLLGARYYTKKIDVWAAGCVLTQMYLGRPIFYERGSHAKGPKYLMLKIFEFAGLPSHSDFEAMGVDPIPVPRRLVRRQWLDPFASVALRDADALQSLLRHIFVYSARDRYNAWAACAHRLFRVLRSKNVRLPSGHPLPNLYDFSSEEKQSMPPVVYRHFAC